MTDKIKVFRINDCDFVAAKSLKEAISFYKKEIGEDLDEPYRMTDKEMKLYSIREEDEPEEKRRTFAEELKNMMNDKKQKFPAIFASVEG